MKSSTLTGIVRAKPPNSDSEPKEGTENELVGRARMNSCTLRSRECEENSSTLTFNPKVPPQGPNSNLGSLSKVSGNCSQTLKNPDSKFISKLTSVGGAMNYNCCTNEQLLSSSQIQWVRKIPQNRSHRAPRSNLRAFIFIYHENPSSDTVNEYISNEDCSELARHRYSNNLKRVKSKGDNEETEGANCLHKNKRKKSEPRKNVRQTVHEVVKPTLNSRKKKLAALKDLGLHALNNAATSLQQKNKRVRFERIERRCPVSWRCLPKINTPLDISGKPIDDGEMLLGAANAAGLKTTVACPSTFWENLEPIFRGLSLDDVTFLNEQIHVIDESTPEGHVVEGGNHTLLVQSEISLCQRLFSAIIDEEELNGNEYDNPKGEDHLHYELSHEKVESDVAFSEVNTLLTEAKYSQMDTNKKILLELSEIEIHLDLLTQLTKSEDEDISGEINKLEEELHEKVSKKKTILGKLEKAVVEDRASQQRVLESRAMERLVEKSYQKYMDSCGDEVSTSKLVKEHDKNAAVTFAQQTLKRCKELEETGINYFNDQVYKNVFDSISPHRRDADLALPSISPGAQDKVEIVASQSPHVPQDKPNGGEDMDLSNLQLPDINDLANIEQGIASWLSADDEDGTQLEDCLGLPVPMDDLADVGIIF